MIDRGARGRDGGASPPAPADASRAARLHARALATERRRLLQPLWNGLDVHLRPHVASGALLAVSGGPDSRALLESVARWPHRFEGEIHVACVDHRTRPESAAEADAVVARAVALGFPAFAVRIDDGVRGEGPLRDARYAALFRAARARGLGAVVVAHHEGDVAENALLSWLGRGGGSLTQGDVARTVDVAVVRPFLELGRDELRLALAACGVDDTFADPDASSARATVRRDLLAPLHAQRADIEQRLARASRAHADDDATLRALGAALLTAAGEGVWHIARPDGATLPILRRALRHAIAAAGSPDPRASSAAVDVAARLMRDRTPGHVDAAGCFVDVDSVGNARVTARVADGRPPTHDVGAGRRLFAGGPMLTMRAREETE